MALLNLFVLLLLSVSCNFNFSPSEEARTPFSFTSALKLNDYGFASADSTTLNSLVVDDQNNIYVLGYFKGELAGVQSQDIDSFLLKISPTGKLMWRKHFRAGHDGIVDSSRIDSAIALIWDDADRALYFLGQTTSALIEGNDSGNTDLFVGKISEHGKVNWLRHYGKETQDQLGADFSETESAGAILLSPKHELIVTFQTQGSVFDAYQGNTDIGVMKVDVSNGAIIAGQQIGGPGQEGLNQGTFALDGDRIVIPLRTQSNLADIVGKPKVSDAGYVVLEDDLSVSAIVQLGQNSYAEWAMANNFTGNVTADDQFRSVVVNGPGDYLFFGKTSNNLADTAQANDYFFARYVDNKLASLIQYGANRLPEGTQAEEPRYMIKAENGGIYCVGHSRSSLFEAAQGTINPLVFRVDENGKLLNGVQLGSVTSHQQGVGNNYYTLIQQANFIVRDGKIILGANNASSSSGPTESMIWQVDAF